MNCPKCREPLTCLKVEAGHQPEGNTMQPEIERETCTCKNKGCPYYDKTLVWDKQNGWIELP